MRMKRSSRRTGKTWFAWVENRVFCGEALLTAAEGSIRLTGVFPGQKPGAVTDWI